MANVARLMALELPKDAKISRDAKVMMQELVSEAICFVTSEANDISLGEGRKALTPDDILCAMDALGKLLLQNASAAYPSLLPNEPVCLSAASNASPAQGWRFGTRPWRPPRDTCRSSPLAVTPRRS